ncbi:MAG: amine dehydrogenase large subunit [Gammaproteobacteria bacterium]|jgi:methylamine dehydrogenase heavy chain|nr:amine dehydrogenase large subunit [Gammaproteobacteria bacterium]
MVKRLVFSIFASVLAASASAQEWDTVLGEPLEMPEMGPHWFSVRGNGSAYLIDGDTGSVGGTLELSKFSPAIRPHMDRGRIYAYGSFYTRNTYGDRTDVLIVYDTATTLPVTEIEIPPKAAGIGHPGMIGLIEDRFVGVWNITPAISVSIVDIESNEFVGEISTPNCAGVYPVDGGFISVCADGTAQIVTLASNGEEGSRSRSDVFFDLMEDPVLDYAVPSAEGWIFMTMNGMVFEVTVDSGKVSVSDGWSINPPDTGATDRNGIPLDGDDDWRLGGRQPFAFSPTTGVLAVVMHQGGGQETFEDPGTEIWAFNMATQRRGYRLEMEEGREIRSVQMTMDEDPLMLLSVDDEIEVREPNSGALHRVIEDISGSTIQALYH